MCKVLSSTLSKHEPHTVFVFQTELSQHLKCNLFPTYPPCVALDMDRVKMLLV
jgi:hypothetical protein